MAMEFIEHEGSQSQAHEEELFAHLEPAIKETLLDLLGRPYWSRVWVAQGIMHGKELIIYHGQKALAWKRHIRRTAVWKLMEGGNVARERKKVAKD
jgi:hypothetical protein